MADNKKKNRRYKRLKKQHKNNTTPITKEDTSVKEMEDITGIALKVPLIAEEIEDITNSIPKEKEISDSDLIAVANSALNDINIDKSGLSVEEKKARTKAFMDKLKAIN